MSEEYHTPKDLINRLPLLPNVAMLPNERSFDAGTRERPHSSADFRSFRSNLFDSRSNLFENSEDFVVEVPYTDPKDSKLYREPIRKMIRLVVLSNAWFEPESTLWRVSHKLDHFIAEWKIIFKLLPNYLSIGQEPWSSGNGRRLMFQSLWVRILAPNTGWTFFHIYSLKRPKINEKEAGVGAF